MGDASRIGAAALGPLPLALALGATGSYAGGLVALAGLAALCAMVGLRMPAGRVSSPASAVA